MTDRKRARGVNGLVCVDGAGMLTPKSIESDSIAAVTPSSRLGVGFTSLEMITLYAAYRSGARGVILVAMRQGKRILTLAIPPVGSEQGLYRQMREAARRLRASYSDGWLLARRATALLPPTVDGSVTVLLIQAQICLSEGGSQYICMVSSLDVDGPPTFYNCGRATEVSDRIIRLLSEAIRQP